MPRQYIEFSVRVNLSGPLLQACTYIRIAFWILGAPFSERRAQNVGGVNISRRRRLLTYILRPTLTIRS